MKKIGFLLIFALCLVLSGCNKEDEPKYESLDIGYHTWTFKIRVLDKNGEDILNYKIPCSGVISRPAASTSCRSFFITSAGIHLRSTLTVRTRLRLRTMSIGA